MSKIILSLICKSTESPLCLIDVSGKSKEKIKVTEAIKQDSEHNLTNGSKFKSSSEDKNFSKNLVNYSNNVV